MNTNFDERDLNILEWPLILEKLQSCCATSAGKARAGACVPLSKDDIILQHQKITALVELEIQDAVMDFSGITDISALIERSRKGSLLSLDEIFAVKNFLRGTLRLRSFIKAHCEEFPVLMEHLEELAPCPALDRELSVSITDEGELSSERYPVLRRLRASINETRAALEKKLSAIINSPSMEGIIQDRIFTTVNQRYCIIIRAGARGRTGGTILDVSASGSTFYLEPDSVRSLNDRYIMAGRELENEIEKILSVLSSLTGEHAAELKGNIRTAAYLDFISGGAKFSKAIKGAAPVITDSPVIRLKKARHPLLQLMEPETVVANDIDLGDKWNCLIISGANTGGKTVLLKTAGCAVLMTRMGLHIPASPDSEIGVFSSIVADIGDDQNLQQSLSSFSGQISIINRMLEKSSPETLVLIDEIIVGTNPRQGAAMAQAVLEYMADTGCRIIVTTHYSELKELASSCSRFKNASVSFDLDSLRPTYRLVTGLPGVSYAIEIAGNYGLPKPILARTLELTDERDLSVEALLEETQRFRQEMEEEKNTLALRQQKLTAEEERLREKERKLNIRSRELKEEKGLAFLDELKQMKQQAVEKIRELQTADIKKASEIQKELSEKEGELNRRMAMDRQKEIRERTGELVPSELKPGDRVFSAALEKEGIIDSISPDLSSAVIIFGGTIKARFPMETLFLPEPVTGKEKKKEKKDAAAKRSFIPEQPSGHIPGTVQTSYNTIDIRGHHIADGLAAMESGLDYMYKNNTDIVIIIHGQGTGALKKAVREQLKMSMYVSDFRPGETGEGGDGVTLVRMRS